MVNPNGAKTAIDLDDFERRVNARSNWSWGEVLDLIEAARELVRANHVLIAGWHDYAVLVDNGDPQALRLEEALHAFDSQHKRA